MKTFTTLISSLSLLLFSCKYSVNADVSKSYLRDRKGNVFYAPGGNWFELGAIPVNGADIKTFRPVAEEYAMDKNSVYYRSGAVQGADKQSFKILKDGFSCDRRSYFVYGQRINELDRKQGRIISGRYLANGNLVYFATYNNEQHLLNLIPGADPAAFRVADEQLKISISGEQIYYEQYKLPVKKTADFKLLQSGLSGLPCFQTANQLCWITLKSTPDTLNGLSAEKKRLDREGQPLYMSLVKPVSAIQKNRYWLLVNKNLLYRSADENHVLIERQERKLQFFDTDPRYIRYGENVYYCAAAEKKYTAKTIDDRSNTFKVLNLWYALNEKGVYYKGDRIAGADPGSFQLLDTGKHPRYGADAADRFKLYHWGKPVAENTPQGRKQVLKN